MRHMPHATVWKKLTSILKMGQSQHKNFVVPAQPAYSTYFIDCGFKASYFNLLISSFSVIIVLLWLLKGKFALSVMIVRFGRQNTSFVLPTGLSHFQCSSKLFQCGFNLSIGDNKARYIRTLYNLVMGCLRLQFAPLD